MTGEDVEVTYFTCDACRYSFENTDRCHNPRCYENPGVSEEVKAKWRAEDEQRKQEKERREMLNRARAMAFEPRKRR